MFTGSDDVRAFPANPLQVHQIPGKDGLALRNVEPVSAEPSALCNEHSFSPVLRDFHFCCEVVGRIENAGRIAVRCSGNFPAIGKYVAARAQAWLGYQQSGNNGIVERQDLVFFRLLPEQVVS